MDAGFRQRAAAPLPPLGTAQPTQAQLNAPQPSKKQLKLTQAWIRCTELLRRKDYEQAFRLMLKEGDDIYLLRLIA